MGKNSSVNKFQKLREKNRKREAEREKERVKNYGRPRRSDNLSSVRTNQTGSRFRGVNDLSSKRGLNKQPTFMKDFMKVVQGNEGKKPTFNNKKKRK